MVDFSKLKIASTLDVIESPFDIFNRLPKPDYIDDLHQSQYEVLRQWFTDRKCKDFIVKLNTGGGKTLVGLLMALSSARELKKGALYLVENQQLADQVVNQAEQIGIRAKAYTRGSASNAEFRNGNTILVASYQALFNGLSTFGKLHDIEHEEVSIIIFDDAHSAFTAVRNSFTVSINADEDLFHDVCRLFRADFCKIDRQTTFDDFVSNGVKSAGSEVLEVPFWSWLNNIDSVASLVSAKECDLSDEDKSDTADALKFSWPLIKDGLKYCRAIISNKAFTITPYLPMVDLFPTYVDAPRRVFMSATFADDGAIIRAFEPEGNKVPKIISPQTLAGVGRRMILTLDNNILPLETLKNKMRQIASSKKGVVVLVPSSYGAKEWTEGGMQQAKKEDISEIIKGLKEGKIPVPIVFTNRYNGIDLPKDACRVLVIDGIPTGASDYEKLSFSTLSSSKLYARTIAQTLEQGIGRGTRGSGDYCTVIMVGEKLCEWIKDEKHLRYFSLPTQAQIKCGVQVMHEVSNTEEYLETIEQGMNGAERYAAYLSDYMGTYIGSNEEQIDDELVEFAHAERTAFRSWRRGEEGEAVSVCLAYAENQKYEKTLCGYMYQLAAQIYYSCGKPTEAQDCQKKAHSHNHALSKSVMLINKEDASEQASRIVKKIINKDKKKDLASYFDEKTDGILKTVDHKKFEFGLKELGFFLGFEAKQTDKNGNRPKGPDVVWLSHYDKTGFALEAKSAKKEDNSFNKVEHGQLLVGEKWGIKNYPNYSWIGVSIHPNNRASIDAIATSTYVLTLEKLNLIRKRTRALLLSVQNCSIHENERIAKCDDLLNKYKLKYDSLQSEYFEYFHENRKDTDFKSSD